MRMDLIKMVYKEKLSVKVAAESIGIKFSTAKAILKVFRIAGRVSKKKGKN